MKLIGKGTFTKAYLRDDGKVQLHTSDPVKECQALWGFGDSELFPTVTRIDDEVYEMEYFPKVSSLKNNLTEYYYSLYKALRQLSVICENSYDLYSRWYEEISRSIPERFAEEKEALLDALDSLADYGPDIAFEISPRNVAVKDGKLILLDCFFFRSKLTEVTGR